MIKTCPICGKEFEPDYAQRVFCSVECSYKHTLNKLRAKKQVQFTKKKCAVCGKEFDTTARDNQKYCSRQCYQKAAQELRRRPVTKKECAVCGKEFEPSGKQKYCSRQCYKKAVQELQRHYREEHREEKKELATSPTAPKETQPKKKPTTAPKETQPKKKAPVTEREWSPRAIRFFTRFAELFSDVNIK